MSLLEKICSLHLEQGITIKLIRSALFMTISIIVLANCTYLQVSLEEEALLTLVRLLINVKVLKKLSAPVDPLKRLYEKTVEVLPAIVGSVVGAILTFSAKLL